MAKRSVMEIDESKCNGCGLCASGCPEGALRIIDGKARLVGESLCDGLGACIGECPEGAITVTEREAEAYDERRVIENIIPKGASTIAAHLHHLHAHGQEAWHTEALAILEEKGISLPVAPARKFDALRPRAAVEPCGCPGSAARSFAGGTSTGSAASRPAAMPGSDASALEQWPIQLHLVNPLAPHFRGADILIAADCTAFACGAFHRELLAGRKLVIACPKLDDGQDVYVGKIRALVDESMAASVTVAIMEVPCCGGLSRLVDEALAGSKRKPPVTKVVVGIEGGALKYL